MTVQSSQSNLLLQQYLTSINSPEPEILTQLRAETNLHRKGNMSIAPEQAQLLTWLA